MYNISTNHQINKLNYKTMKYMKSTYNKKYVYDSNELATYLFETLKKSLTLFLNKKMRVLNEIHYLYDDIKGFSSRTNIIWNIDYLEYSKVITIDNYNIIIQKISKSNKKRINRLLFKLNININNYNLAIKILNFIESISGKKNKFILDNHKEELIIQKRERYKELIKFIKMDLVSELNKAREEYKKEKGDYYKIKNKETIEHNKVKKYFFEIINIFKK